MNIKHRPVKSLGQNFLVDSSIQQRIVDACQFNANQTVLEIGPGQGAITSKIIPLVNHFIAVEKDRHLASELKERFIGPKINIVEGDFLKFDIPSDSVVVGNIPYNISTPIIERLIENRDCLKHVFLMVQLEFGQRLAAKAGEKPYGSLSCFAQYYFDINILFKIKAGSFHPRPKVDSCLVSLFPKKNLETKAIDESKLFKLIQTAFMQRRKTIVNALSVLVESEKLIQELDKLGISSKARPEEINLLNYIKLSNKLML